MNKKTIVKSYGKITQQIKAKKSRKSLEPLSINYQLLKDYFISKLKALNLKSTSNRHLLIEQLTNFDQNLISEEITEEQVLEICRNLKHNKATSDDRISVWMIKTSITSVLTHILCLINMIINTKTFLNCWKIAFVTPIHKSGDVFDSNNYRPVSVLPIMNKIFGKYISNQIKKNLSENNLISKNQFGFQSKVSTCDALLNTQKEICFARDKNECACAVALDLIKAFDLFDHHILYGKLKSYSFNDVIKLFESYLSNLKQ